jgi:hypothetical protein
MADNTLQYYLDGSPLGRQRPKIKSFKDREGPPWTGKRTTRYPQILRRAVSGAAQATQK